MLFKKKDSIWKRNTIGLEYIKYSKHGYYHWSVKTFIEVLNIYYSQPSPATSINKMTLAGPL